MNARRVRCVICSYDVEPAAIVSVLNRIGPDSGMDFYGMVVNNRPNVQPVAVHGWQVHAGTNSLMDMSAFAEGARAICEDLQPNEPVLFVNDSVLTKHNARRHLRKLVGYIVRVEKMQVPCIVGKVDHYLDHCYVNPWSNIDAYVSTFAFILNKGGVRALLDIFDSVDSVMGAVDLDFHDMEWGSGLEIPFREFLRTHITMSESPTSWYQSRRYQHDKLMLQKKARCVYLEHRLSGEIGRQGVVVSLYPRQRDKVRFWLADQVAKVQRRTGMRSLPDMKRRQ